VTAFRVLLVFIFGGAGSACRYLLGGWIVELAGPVFPYGTITINTLGSFLIALIMAISLNSTLISPDVRIALTTGVMGGFTTYSTFNYESVSLFTQGALLLGALNILVTVLMCLVAGFAGLALGRWLVAH
jgi:CrcB protein